MLLLEHTVCLFHAQQEKLLQKNLQRINCSSYFYPLTSFTFFFSVLFIFLLPSLPFLIFFFSRGDIFRPPLIHFHHLHPGMVGVHACVREVRLEAGCHGNPSGGNIRESVISWHSCSLPAVGNGGVKRDSCRRCTGTSNAPPIRARAYRCVLTAASPRFWICKFILHLNIG